MIMWRRLMRAMRYALREEDFGAVLGAGGFLILAGTISYAVGNDWNVVDSLYFRRRHPDDLERRRPRARPRRRLAEAVHRLLRRDRDRDPGRDRAPLGFAFIEIRRQDKARRDEARR